MAPTQKNWSPDALAGFAFACVGGISIAALPAGVGLLPLATAALASAAIAMGLLTASAPRPETHRLERAAPLLLLVFFVPLASMAVPPGADMAMHLAMARALADGGGALSPAWGEVAVPLYPRGLSALSALLSPALGLAKAGLLAAALSQVGFALGTASVFRHALRVPYPTTTAVVATLLARTPQGMFGWGGNPTALAAGLALLAAGLLARVYRERAPLLTVLPGALLLLLGSVAVHPTGALVGAFVVASLPLIFAVQRAELTPGGWRAGLGATAAALAALGAAMVAIKLGGPPLSTRERTWIVGYQRDVERLIDGPPWQFAWRVWPAWAKALGRAAWVTGAVAALAQLSSAAGRRRVLFSGAVVLAWGALLAVGPHLPVVGVLLYPARFAPLAVLATAPLVARAIADASGRSRLVAPIALAALLAASATVHVPAYQLQQPIATRDDVEAIACVARTVPPGAVIAGAYGDATQWIPALAGLRVTNAHPHVSLLDEVEAQPVGAPEYLFVGERLRYPPPAGLPIPPRAPLCRVGASALYRLER